MEFNSTLKYYTHFNKWNLFLEYKDGSTHKKLINVTDRINKTKGNRKTYDHLN